MGDILGIWAHPDDEAWLTAGVMMRAVAAGRRVTCVTATRGEAGFPDDDPRSDAERRQVRETELGECLRILEVTDHRWLGYGDGRCADVPDEEAADVIAALIAEAKPDTVLTFGPDGGTGHSDHIAVCRWTTLALERGNVADARLLYATKTKQWGDAYFGGIDPARVMMVEGLQPERLDESEVDVWFTCDDALAERKVAALAAQASQLAAMIEDIGIEGYTALTREEFFRDVRPTDAAFLERTRDLRPPPR